MKPITPRDFLAYGIDKIAYLRPVLTDDKIGWSLHAADGRVLTVQDTAATASVLARHNDLEPLTVH